MLKNRAAAILITGLVFFMGATSLAQSIQEKTTVLTSEFSLDRELMQEPVLFCMNIDRGRQPITHKRLALDPSIQELRWVAAHGPRQDMLEAFLSQQSGNGEVAEDGQLTRVGGTVESWSQIVATAPRTDLSPVSIGRLDVSLIGPESIRRISE